MADKLNAIEVLNWEYMVQIAQSHNHLVYTTDLKRALAKFAFELTQAEETTYQNDILRSLLIRMTYGHSKEKNREVIEDLAEKFCTQAYLLIEFAKQEGIRV